MALTLSFHSIPPPPPRWQSPMGGTFTSKRRGVVFSHKYWQCNKVPLDLVRDFRRELASCVEFAAERTHTGGARTMTLLPHGENAALWHQDNASGWKVKCEVSTASCCERREPENWFRSKRQSAFPKAHEHRRSRASRLRNCAEGKAHRRAQVGPLILVAALHGKLWVVKLNLAILLGRDVTKYTWAIKIFCFSFGGMVAAPFWTLFRLICRVNSRNCSDDMSQFCSQKCQIHAARGFRVFVFPTRRCGLRVIPVFWSAVQWIFTSDHLFAQHLLASRRLALIRDTSFKKMYTTQFWCHANVWIILLWWEFKLFTWWCPKISITRCCSDRRQMIISFSVSLILTVGILLLVQHFAVLKYIALFLKWGPFVMSKDLRQTNKLLVQKST